MPLGALPFRIHTTSHYPFIYPHRGLLKESLISRGNIGI